MDNFKLDIFDLMGYMVPGSILLFNGLILGSPQIRSVCDIHTLCNSFSLGSFIALALMSYPVGFVVHYFGHQLFNAYRYLANRWFGTKINNLIQETRKWTLVREYGEKHLKILERWSLLKVVGQNLAAVSLFSAAISILKYFTSGQYFEWLVLAFGLVLLAIVFWIKSADFRRYVQVDIDDTISVLGLESKL